MEQTRRSLFRMLLGAPLAIAVAPAVAKVLPEMLPAPSHDSIIAFVEQRMNDAYSRLRQQCMEDVILTGRSDIFTVGGAYGSNDFGNSKPQFMTYGQVFRNGNLGKDLEYA